MAKQLERDWVTVYFERGIDVVNRRLFLVGDIDEGMIGDLIKGIYLMEHQDSTKKIELFINTYGGDVYETLALYDTLQTVRCPVETVACGKIMSAGILLVAAGNKGTRYATENCSFMYHDVGTDQSNMTLTSAIKDVEHIKELRLRLNRLIAKHSNKDAAFWGRISGSHGDSYFDVDTAIEYGVCDSIWNEKEGE